MVGPSILQIVLGSVLASALSALVAGFSAYEAGWRHADARTAAAILTEQKKHADMLWGMAQRAGAIDANAIRDEVSNDEIEKALEYALRPREDVPQQPVAVCKLDADFLRTLSKLR